MKYTNTSPRRLFRLTDLIWIGVLLAAAAVFGLLLSPGSATSQACIYYKGQRVTTCSLEEDQIFSLKECPGITFEVRNGAIRFASSDCPDQTCVRTGFISKSSQYAVCLPHQVSIRIIEKDAPDALTS